MGCLQGPEPLILQHASPPPRGAIPLQWVQRGQLPGSMTAGQTPAEPTVVCALRRWHPQLQQQATATRGGWAQPSTR